MRRKMELSDIDWMKDARCKDESLDKFFDHTKMKEGIKICAGCSVRHICLQWRIDTVDPWDTDHGVWGATTPAERDRIKQLKRAGRYRD